MVAVHQFVPSYTTRSAIGTHTRHVTDVLRGLGIETRTYVGEARGVGRHEVHPYRRYRPGPARGRTWLLYQLSTGSLMADFLVDRPEPKIVNYHNITPGHFLEPWEPAVVPELVEGRHQIDRLAPHTVLGVSDSAYNNDELIAAGYAAAEVATVLVDYDELGAETDRALESRLNATKRGADWLFVGRLSPHKCQHDVVKAFAVYRQVYDPGARLWLAGGSASHAYLSAIERFVAATGMQDAVTITGSISQPEMAAYHRAADVVVCLSEHEGFCVPLVEAMWHRIPVVAYAAAAVPETAGDAALLLDEKSPTTVAAAVARVVSDPALRATLVEAGSARLDDFSLKATKARFAEVIEGLVASAP